MFTPDSGSDKGGFVDVADSSTHSTGWLEPFSSISTGFSVFELEAGVPLGAVCTVTQI